MRNLAVESGAKMLKAMGNEKRLEILFQLYAKEQNVGELEKVVGLSQSALSQHLAVLRGENLVKTRRSAQTIYYSINSEKAVKILELLNSMYNKRY
jgi:DNA-binding transcriptional ArsR family regulator